MQSLKDLAQYIIDTARQAGADEVDVVILDALKSSITVRLGKIEELKQASPKQLGIRVFKNKRKALTYSSDFRKDSLKSLIKRTVALVKVSSQDSFAGLPDKALLGVAKQPLALYDKKLETMSTERKIEMVQELEEKGLAKDKLITNSDGASWHDSRSRFLLANSKGFLATEQYSSCSLSLSLIAEKEGVKQRDYWSSSARYYDLLESIDSIASRAVHRTVRKIGAVKPQSQKVPVVFDPTTGRDFLSIIARTVVGDAIYRQRSFLAGREGDKIAADRVTIIDDGLLARGLGSRRFDDEGLPRRRNVVVDQGVLKTFLCDCYAARKLGMQPTGSASRDIKSEPSSGTSNFFMQSGEHTPKEIIASVEDGLLLTQVHWVGINYVTGDYSRGAEGMWIKNGRISHPVQEFTVAGNMNTMLSSVSMIGNDLTFRAPKNAPTFKVDELMISGS